jgi:hypothetical protein
MRDDYFDKYALSVECPTCAALRLRDCDTSNRFHPARINRGIRQAVRDDHDQHQRAVAAYAAVRAEIAAGREPDQRAVTTALACACPSCLDRMVEQAEELLPWL